MYVFPPEMPKSTVMTIKQNANSLFRSSANRSNQWSLEDCISMLVYCYYNRCNNAKKQNNKTYVSKTIKHSMLTIIRDNTTLKHRIPEIVDIDDPNISIPDREKQLPSDVLCAIKEIDQSKLKNKSNQYFAIFYILEKTNKTYSEMEDFLCY